MAAKSPPKRRGSDRIAANLAATTLPPRKPMVMTRRVSLFEREIAVRLAPAAYDILMEQASVLSEGEIAANRFAGSTMVTIDLAKTASKVSDPVTPRTARQVATLYPADDRLLGRTRRLAAAEARKTARRELAEHNIDLEASASGHKIHLNINVEAKPAQGQP